MVGYKALLHPSNHHCLHLEMTKRQRIIDQEEAPISSEPIRKAEERVEELKQWIKARKQYEQSQK